MSLTTPTTSEIASNILAQLEASFNQTIPLLPKSFLRVLSKVLSGVFVLLYKYAGFTFLQLFVKYASDKETVVNGVIIVPLIEWGRLIGVGDPTSATNAEILINITVENQTGVLISGSQLVNSANGFTYITIGAVTLDAPIVQATIRAVQDQADGGGKGALGNLNPGDTVTFANPLPNVARDAVVDSQVVTGADAEATEVYRQRVIDRFQQRPQGGALADYKIWSEEVEGILTAYPYTSDCPGQVDVYIEAVPTISSPDGIPTTAQLEAVLDSIEFDENGLPTRRPANALANTFPITRTLFDVQVLGVVVDDLAQVQADIEQGIDEYFLDRKPFLEGLSVLPRKDRITNSAVAGIVEDIVSAGGGIFQSVAITQVTVPVLLYGLGIGEEAKSLVTFV